MTKLILLFCSLFLISGTFITESVYDHSVVSIEGDNIALSVYQGKKMLIMTLPTKRSASADSLLVSIDSLRIAFAGSLVMIGVPAIEDGFAPAIRDSLKNWYRSILPPDILVTDGLYTRKTSGSQQHPLFKFLTDRVKNGHFDEDVSGPGNQFILWTSGELVGVFGRRTKLSSTAIHDVLQ